MFLLLYVDDIILTGNDPTFIASIIQLLSSNFDLKDLGLLHYFLGLQIKYTALGLFVSGDAICNLGCSQEHLDLKKKP